MNALGRAWRKPRGFLLDVAPAVLCLVGLFWLGLIPLDDLPGPDFELRDKVWHFFAFFGVAGLMARALCHWGQPHPRADRIAAWASAGLGALLEVLQSFTRFRSADIADFVADALGALAAYFVLRALS